MTGPNSPGSLFRRPRVAAAAFQWIGSTGSAHLQTGVHQHACHRHQTLIENLFSICPTAHLPDPYMQCATVHPPCLTNPRPSRAPSIDHASGDKAGQKGTQTELRHRFPSQRRGRRAALRDERPQAAVAGFQFVLAKGTEAGHSHPPHRFVLNHVACATTSHKSIRWQNRMPRYGTRPAGHLHRPR